MFKSSGVLPSGICKDQFNHCHDAVTLRLRPDARIAPSAAKVFKKWGRKMVPEAYFVLTTGPQNEDHFSDPFCSGTVSPCSRFDVGGGDRENFEPEEKRGS